MARDADAPDEDEAVPRSLEFEDEAPQRLETVICTERVLVGGLTWDDRKSGGLNCAGMHLNDPDHCSIVDPLESNWTEPLRGAHIEVSYSRLYFGWQGLGTSDSLHKFLTYPRDALDNEVASRVHSGSA